MVLYLSTAGEGSPIGMLVLSTPRERSSFAPNVCLKVHLSGAEDGRWLFISEQKYFMYPWETKVQSLKDFPDRGALSAEVDLKC